ncbi:hypothetical protein GGE07_005499 [Sinorhizobium terangae]|nr:hypothetical protein [Sinorhizobium terangae]
MKKSRFKAFKLRSCKMRYKPLKDKTMAAA